MLDSYAREIDYMRISLTDRCNLRCRYCMPEDIDLVPMQEILTLEEIFGICEEAATLGIKKIKVTGGEPLVRRGCTDLIRMIKQIPEISQVTMTTNGVLVNKYIEELYQNGLDAINISLDTVDRKLYEKITGFDKLRQVMDGIKKCCQLGLPTKINVVLQKGMNEKEWENLILLAKEYPVDVRFIEMMPIGAGQEFEPIYNEEVLDRIRRKYKDIRPDMTVRGNGPAAYYMVPGFLGAIGFISAMHGKFCKNCNRIRLTSTGQLKPCLCFEDTIDLRESIRGGQREEVRGKLKAAILKKPKQHNFEQGDAITESKKMVQIGG